MLVLCCTLPRCESSMITNEHLHQLTGRSATSTVIRVCNSCMHCMPLCLACGQVCASMLTIFGLAKPSLGIH